MHRADMDLMVTELLPRTKAEPRGFSDAIELGLGAAKEEQRTSLVLGGPAVGTRTRLPG